MPNKKKIKTKKDDSLADLDFRIQEISKEIKDELLDDSDEDSKPEKRSGLFKMLKDKMDQKEEIAQEADNNEEEISDEKKEDLIEN